MIEAARLKNLKFNLTLHWNNTKHWNRIYWFQRKWQNLQNFLRVIYRFCKETGFHVAETEQWTIQKRDWGGAE